MGEAKLLISISPATLVMAINSMEYENLEQKKILHVLTQDQKLPFEERYLGQMPEADLQEQIDLLEISISGRNQSILELSKYIPRTIEKPDFSKKP